MVGAKQCTRVPASPAPACASALDQFGNTGCQRPPGNSNPGYTDLEDWAAGPYAEALARAKPKTERILTKPRQSRPEGRVRANRLKP